jgi:FkbM family methyltransferase
MYEFKDMIEVHFDTTSIRVAHGATFDVADDSLIVFSDSTHHDWHLLRIQSEALRDSTVGIEIRFCASSSCKTDFYINAMGGIDVAVVSASGLIKDRGISRALETQINPDCSVTVRALYESRDASATFGSYLDGGVYAGFGTPQFEIKSVRFYAKKGPWRNCVVLPGRITLVDVGAAGGVQAKWLELGDALQCVLFEPGKTAAALLKDNYGKRYPAHVIDEALFNIDGEKLLFVTRFPQCSSLLEPCQEMLFKYKVSSCFAVTNTEMIPVRRYDSLWREGRVPFPDVIKIDVQGAELQVLEGFGALLETCVGIELETHFYRIYQNQALIGDLISYLQPFGFFLRKLEPQTSFDRDLVEANAYFTKCRKLITNSGQDMKLQLVEHVWGLNDESPVGALLAAKYRSRSNSILNAEHGFNEAGDY